MAQTILPGEDQGIFKDFDGTAISQSLGPIAKDALQKGLFDVKDGKDLWGNVPPMGVLLTKSNVSG